jgi:ribonuclease BN (tRNA processing enzyme)
VLADHRQRTGSQLSVASIDHLLLTHLHGDHCGGVEAFLFMRRFLVRRKPFLYGAPAVLDPLWPTRLRGGMAHLTACVPEWSLAELPQRLAHPSYLHPEADSAAQQRLGTLPPKPLPSYSYPTMWIASISSRSPRSARSPSSAASPTTTFPPPPSASPGPGRYGPLFAYSADTAFDPDLIAWLHEAALIVHETNFGIHTPLASLLQLPPDIRASSDSSTTPTC